LEIHLVADAAGGMFEGEVSIQPLDPLVFARRRPASA
jgi:hypothetical protein